MGKTSRIEIRTEPERRARFQEAYRKVRRRVPGYKRYTPTFSEWVLAAIDRQAERDLNS